MAVAQLPASKFISLPDKQVLLSAYQGKTLSELPTPALVLDRAIIKRNCQRMAHIAQAWGVSLRSHIKTHKTAEGVRYMLEAKQGAGKIIVSTLAEAWGVLDSGLVKDGVVEDILYGLPVGPHKLAELHALRLQVQAQSTSPDATVRLLIDNDAQISALDKFVAAQASQGQAWSVMVKLDCGTKRAGLTPESDTLKSLLKLLSAAKHVRLHGFYAHAGHSYGSDGPEDAESFLTEEVQAVNKASEVAHKIIPPSALPPKLVLSVGSTPTAHAASRAPSSETIQRLQAAIKGDVELHAGNYPFLDLQQLATKAIPGITASAESSKMADVAISVVCTVISSYAGRGADVTEDAARKSAHTTQACAGDEALVDGGGIAFSKDGGPWGGFGHVVYPSQLRGWQLGRVSQEHGVLTLRGGSPQEWQTQWALGDGKDIAEQPRKTVVGERVRVVPQHACMTCSAHPWFYVVDSDADDRHDTFEQQVVDVWVPWKGW